MIVIGDKVKLNENYFDKFKNPKIDTPDEIGVIFKVIDKDDMSYTILYPDGDTGLAWLDEVELVED